MNSHRLNNRGTWLLVALMFFGFNALLSSQTQELKAIKSCEKPALDAGVVNCNGQGDEATGLFLLLGTKVNLNRAQAREIELIPKVHKKVAQAIFERREELGRFSSYEELDEVKGVGPKTLESIKTYTTIGR